MKLVRNVMKCLFNKMSSETSEWNVSQIFKPREAFMMLSRELLDIIKKQSFEIFVDSVGVSAFISLVNNLDSEFDLYPCLIPNAIFSLFLHAQDDVYTWAVELASFDPESNLYKVPLPSRDGCPYPMNSFMS